MEKRAQNQADFEKLCVIEEKMPESIRELVSVLEFAWYDYDNTNIPLATVSNIFSPMNLSDLGEIKEIRISDDGVYFVTSEYVLGISRKLNFFTDLKFTKEDTEDNV